MCCHKQRLIYKPQESDDAMAKVVLIDVAGWQGGVGAGRPYPNVGIGYLVATLKHSGHNVTVLDLNNEMISNGEISTCLVLADPTVVGISVKTATMKDACRVGQLVKRIMPRVPVVVGGPHATVSTQELIRENWVNFVLMGEGDLVFPELCHRLSRGLPVNDLPGVVCKGTISNPVAAARVGNSMSYLSPTSHASALVSGRRSRLAIR